MKVQKEDKQNEEFRPVVITLEIQEEFDLLLGLLNGESSQEKKDCEGFDEQLCHDMWESLNISI